MHEKQYVQLTPGDMVCFICHLIFRVPTVIFNFLKQAVTTRLSWLCVDYQQNRLSMTSVYTTAVITYYNLQK